MDEKEDSRAERWGDGVEWWVIEKLPVTTLD